MLRCLRKVSGGVLLGVIAVLLLAGPGCSNQRASGGPGAGDNVPNANAPSGNALNDELELAVAAFKVNAPETRPLFNEAYGYAIFPAVTKGAFGVGVAKGRGGVFERGERIGYATLTQSTVGAQIGAQVYREVIFFEDRAALNRFKRGGLAFSGRASAAGGTAGKTTAVNYDRGIAVFTLTEGGLMAEASIGGQEFRFTPRSAGGPGTNDPPTMEDEPGI